MRVAVFSDIHANYNALRALKKDAERAGVDVFWFLGDVVGYGPDPIPTVKAMRDLFRHDGAGWVAGNHDMLVAGRLKAGNTLSIDGKPVNTEGWAWAMLETCRVHRSLLERKFGEGMRWLKSLAASQLVKEPLPGFVIAHGAPTATEDKEIVSTYIRDATYAWWQVDRLLQERKEEHKGGLYLVAVGHWHRRLLYEVTNGKAIEKKPEYGKEYEYKFDTSGGRVILINPGSAGFPRRPETVPSYVILDVEGNRGELTVTIQFRQICYDAEALKSRLHSDVRKMAEHWRPMEGKDDC